MVRVVFNGAVIAETSRALRLSEASYRRSSIYLAKMRAWNILLRPTTKPTVPIKEKLRTSRWKLAENAVKTPPGLMVDAVFAAVAEIAGGAPFYPQRVDFIEIE